MTPLSLRGRLIAWFVGLALALIGAFSLLLGGHVSRALRAGLDARLATRAQGLFALCEWDDESGSIQFGSAPELADVRATAAPDEGFEAWTWPERRLLCRAGSEIAGEAPREASWNPEARPFTEFATSDGEERRRLVAFLARAPATPPHDDEPGLPAFDVLVRVSASLEPLETQLAQIQWRIAALAGFASLAAVAIAVIFARRLVRPLREALQRQERFTANAAHELRNPVAVIRSAAEVALRHDRSGADYRAFLVDVLATSDRLGSLIQALLTLARLDAGALRSTFDEVDLLQVARESAAAHGENERVAVRNGGAAVVRGDERLLRVLADNLIANALRHSGGQPVEVALDEEEGGGVSLRVRDFGPGIPEEVRARVFERFFRVESGRSSDRDGAGLGLSIVAEVARVHSADCRLEDAAPGTRVTVRFPAP